MYYSENHGPLAVPEPASDPSSDPSTSSSHPGWMGWLPIVSVLGFLSCAMTGYGTLVYVVTAEVLPPKVRGVANSFVVCFSYLGGFVVAKTFVDLIAAVNQSGTFWIYGGMCVAAAAFTFLFVPETRGKTEAEIEGAFNRGVAACVRDSVQCKS